MGADDHKHCWGGATMRKRLKVKKHSCKLCKPFKMGFSNRWKPREEAALREWEKGRGEH